ncbi:hypothetical protein T459_04857 [Capsicum annuum]|uniref:Aminotransferase-like plant mobile domain-containing protein n=1 Tax=Capsicum annuum TaxID=4072 RepID=A0A2G3A684_CAPAN|nr:hypothetical protein T459_04857 [Capsicum annuum]
MVNFRDQTAPYPLLEIANDERYSPTSVLTVKVHPPDKVSATTYPKGSNKDLATWNYPQSDFGEFYYVTCYWEWVEDVFNHSKEVLERTKIYDAVFASLFTYDVNENILQAFCELWHSSTNTICVGIAFYRLSNGVSKEVSIRDWVNFWFKGPERYKEPPPRGPKYLQLLRGKLVKTGKGSSRPSSKLNDTSFVASIKTRKQRDDSALLETNSGKMPTKTPLEDKIPHIHIVNEVVDANGDTSLTEGDQDQYWKHKRKKTKEQSSEFVNLDIATIDNEAFSVNDPSSIMPFD